VRFKLPFLIGSFTFLWVEGGGPLFYIIIIWFVAYALLNLKNLPYAAIQATSCTLLLALMNSISRPLTLLAIAFLVFFAFCALFRSKLLDKSKQSLLNDVTMNFIRPTAVMAAFYFLIDLQSKGIRNNFSWLLNGDGFNFVYSTRYLESFPRGIFDYYSQNFDISHLSSSILLQTFSTFSQAPFRITSFFSLKSLPQLPLGQVEVSLSALFLFCNLVFLIIVQDLINNFAIKPSEIKRFLIIISAQLLFWSPAIAGLALANAFLSVPLSCILISSLILITVDKSLNAKHYLLISMPLLVSITLSWSLLTPLGFALVFSRMLFFKRDLKILRNSMTRGAFGIMVTFVGYFAIFQISPQTRNAFFATGGFPRPQFQLWATLLIALFLMFTFIRPPKSFDPSYLLVPITALASLLFLVFMNYDALGLSWNDFLNHPWVTHFYYFSKALWITISALLIAIFCMMASSKKDLWAIAVIIGLFAGLTTTQSFWSKDYRLVSSYKGQKILFNESSTRPSPVPFMFYHYLGWGQDINLNFGAALVWSNYSGHKGAGKFVPTTAFALRGTFGAGDYYTTEINALCEGIRRMGNGGIIYTQDDEVSNSIAHSCDHVLIGKAIVRIIKF
jgi:hypothetical protein